MHYIEISEDLLFFGGALIIKVIIALGLLIFVHELGHFLMALLMRVRVYKFSIGFGPRLFSFTKSGVEFLVSAFPLGGYVLMKGEKLDQEDETKDDSDSLPNKKWWQRCLIAFAGPFANLILAFFLFSIAFLSGRSYEDQEAVIGKVETSYNSVFQENDQIISVNGNPVKSWTQIIRNTKEGENLYTLIRNKATVEIMSDTLKQIDWYTTFKPTAPAIVGEVAPGMPAYKAGILPDDKILEIDGIEIKDWYEMRDAIISNPAESINMKLLRNGIILEKTIILRDNLFEENAKMIGITQKLPVKIEEKYSITESLTLGFTSTITNVYANYYGLYKLIRKPAEIRQNVGSPIMIYSIAKDTSKKGLAEFISFLASLSVVLMVMNLLPIPILDGGHILFAIIEAVIRKPLSLKARIIAQNIGLFTLLLLMFFAFYNDIGNIIQRNFSFKKDRNTIEQSKPENKTDLPQNSGDSTGLNTN